MRQQVSNSYAPRLDELYQQAIFVYKDGRSLHARNLLQQIVQEDNNYAKAWFGLGQIEPKLEDRLFALMIGLQINPNNQKAQAKVQQLSNYPSLDHFALAQRLEAFGMIDTAVTHYQIAQKNAQNADTRQAAQEKLQQLDQPAEKIIVVTAPTTNLIRLTAGPVIIYLLLIFTMSGINPFKISLPLIIGGIIVTLGSLLLTTAYHMPQHQIWMQLFGSNGLNTTINRHLIATIGILFLLLPFGIIFIFSFNELMAYYTAHPLNLSN